MDKDLTYQIIIVDRSGSMRPIAADTAGGLNTLVADQAAAPGRCLVSIVQFDTEVETVVDLVPANQVRPYTLIARGNTALHDAIGLTVTRVGERLAGLQEAQRPGLVVVTILTDGQENSSETYSQEIVAEMIKHQREKYGWIFNFMGTQEDTVLVARNLNISHQNTMTYSTQNVRQAFAGSSASSLRTRSAMYQGEDRDAQAEASAYTEEELDEALTPQDS